MGLALSGGGIRSATFCLGVTQVLADCDLLKHVDFLSTVSGGGFVGSFLTRRLTSDQARSGVAAPRGPEPDPIRYLRQHAKYLAASNLKERWSMVTATLAGMILNWTAPLFLIAAAMLLAVCITKYTTAHDLSIPWAQIFLIAGGITVLSLLHYAYRMRYAERSGGWLLGVATAATLALAVLWALTQAYQLIEPPGFTITWKITSIVAAAVTAVKAVVRFFPILAKLGVLRPYSRWRLSSA